MLTKGHKFPPSVDDTCHEDLTTRARWGKATSSSHFSVAGRKRERGEGLMITGQTHAPARRASAPAERTPGGQHVEELLPQHRTLGADISSCSRSTGRWYCRSLISQESKNKTE